MLLHEKKKKIKRNYRSCIIYKQIGLLLCKYFSMVCRKEVIEEKIFSQRAKFFYKSCIYYI